MPIKLTGNSLNPHISASILFHLEGMKAEKIEFPLYKTDAETFVFAV